MYCMEFSGCLSIRRTRQVCCREDVIRGEDMCFGMELIGWCPSVLRECDPESSWYGFMATCAVLAADVLADVSLLLQLVCGWRGL